MSGSNLSAVSFSVKASGKIVTCSYGRPVLGSSPSIIGGKLSSRTTKIRGFLKFENLFISSTSFRILKRQQSGHPPSFGPRIFFRNTAGWISSSSFLLPRSVQNFRARDEQISHCPCAFIIERTFSPLIPFLT